MECTVEHSVAKPTQGHLSGHLSIAGIVQESIVDGPGIRLTVFAQGCPHACPGCHNPQTHAEEGGRIISTDSILEEVRQNPLLSGVTWSGGEPFQQAAAFAELSRSVKAMGKSIITYTGYTFEHIVRLSSTRQDWKELLELSDYLIDGPYIEERRSYDLRFRGSANQRYIDVQQSLRKGTVICVPEPGGAEAC